MRPSVACRQPALYTASCSRQSCRAVAHIHTQAHGLPLLPLLAHCYEVMLRCCCQTTAGGLTGAATENTYGAGDRTGREKMKENGPFKHFLTNLFWRPKEYNAESPPNNQRDRGVRQSRQWQRHSRRSGTPAGYGGGSSSQWQTLPRQRHQRSRHQRRSQLGDRGDGEQFEQFRTNLWRVFLPFSFVKALPLTLDEIGKLNDNVMLWYLMAKSSIRSGAFQVLTAKNKCFASDLCLY